MQEPKKTVWWCAAIVAALVSACGGDSAMCESGEDAPSVIARWQACTRECIRDDDIGPMCAKAREISGDACTDDPSNSSACRMACEQGHAAACDR